MEVIAKRRALGRGLGALIPGVRQADDPAVVTTVSPAAIRPNPMQPRQHFSEEALEELAESIRQKGILQPLLVRPADVGYELVAGERRLRAAQRLGLESVPVTVRDVSDNEMLEIALIENIQRENLNPLEEARAYRRMLDELDLTQEAIAVRVGKERSTIANSLRLLQLPGAIQSQVERGELSAGHARALASVESEPAKLALAEQVVTRRLTVRQTERLAQQQARRPPDIDRDAAEQSLTEALGTRVRLAMGRGGAGRIEIEYYSFEELNGLIERLGRAPRA